MAEYTIEKIKSKIKDEIKKLYNELPPVLKLRFSHKILRKMRDDEELKQMILDDFFEILEKVESKEEKVRNLLFMLSVLENKKQSFEGKDILEV